MGSDVAAVAAEALVSTWQHLVAANPNGWTRSDSGAVAGVTGVPMPTLNGVWVASPTPVSRSSPICWIRWPLLGWHTACRPARALQSDCTGRRSPEA